LNDNQLLCGTTSHLTNFAILLGGGGGTGRIDDPCLANHLYLMHSFNKHMIVLSCVTGSVLIAWLLFIVYVSCTKSGKKLLYGTEGYRVRQARSAQQLTTDDDNDLA